MKELELFGVLVEATARREAIIELQDRTLQELLEEPLTQAVLDACLAVHAEAREALDQVTVRLSESLAQI
jgi:hypothetical protein